MTSSDDGKGKIAVMWEFLFGDKKGLMPEETMVTEKSDLKSIPEEEDTVVWLGHSSFFMQLHEEKILWTRSSRIMHLLFPSSIKRSKGPMCTNRRICLI